MTSPGGSLTERLQIIVDATTEKAEANFRKLTGSARETGEVASTSANAVRDAADRVAAARDRELTATGNLRVAMTRLDDLRSSGRARADQLAAAEEKVAAAQRTLHSATTSTLRATEDQTAVQQRATTEMDRAADTGGRLRGQMDGLVQSAVALGGAGLVAILRGLGDGFATGARDAGQLATSMNATTAEASAFLGLVGSMGLELGDLLEIQAEFATKTKDGLTLVGTELAKNADGTVNWSDTLVDALAELQQIPDATERNRQGFAMFGEEGYKQLSRLVNSGTDVRDALAKIGVPFTDEDVQMAADYDAAMMDLTLSGQRAQQQLGRLLLPVLTGIAEGVGDVVDVVEEVPLPLAAATTAALLLGLTGFDPAAAAGGRLSAVLAVVNREIALYGAAAATSGAGSALLTTGLNTAASAGSRLMAMAGGPLGLALIGLGGVYALASAGADDLRESTRRAAEELSKTDPAVRRTDGAVKDAAAAIIENAGAWERAAAAARGYEQAVGETQGGLGSQDFGGVGSGLAGLGGLFGDTELAAEGAAAGIEDAAEELGAFGAQQQDAQATTKALNDLIAEGTTEGRAFAEAVQAAAEAEAAQTRTTDLAKAALDAYNATTRDAVQTQLDLYAAQLGQKEGLIGVQQAWYDVAQTVDDSKTPWNEVGEAQIRALQTTLDYGSAAADAAVAAARAAGQVLDPLAEAKVRADATIAALRESLNDPNLTAAGRQQIEEMITGLETAAAAGDIEAILRLSGVSETEGELDETTRDRDAIVRVESRNGPAVVEYLGRVAQERLSIIRVESRNGPAVREYLDGLAAERLSIIRVESRGGPAVDEYLDRLAGASRVAYIDVRERAGASVRDGVGAMRGAPGMLAAAGMASGGNITIGQLTVTPQVDSGGRLTAAGQQVTGRQVVAALREHVRQNGPLRGMTG